MSVQLSVTAQSLLKETGIQPQIILDIEGIDLIFGARPIAKLLFWDEDDPEAIWDNDLNWDGKIKDIRSREYISLGETTNNISQQIAPDKGSTSSISTVNVSLVDKNGEVSKALAFDKIGDVLGRKAIFSIGFSDGAYPEDATPIFRGVIVDFYTDAGTVMISMASPESLKKQVYLEKFQTELTAAINSVVTVIPVTSTAGIYQAQDALKTYIKVGDEIMKVTSIDSDTQITVIRGQLNTFAAAHDDEEEVETFYTLTGKPLDLALKVMMSKEGNEFFTSLDLPKSINYVSLTESIQNAIVFDYYSIEEKTGLTVGDSVKLNSGANSGVYTIASFGLIESGGSFIVVNETLTTEIEYTGGFEYRSKYNTLSTGLGMLTSEVDVAQFELIDSQFGANFVEYEIYVKDTIDDAKDFIDEQIYFPQGLYSIPRKARSSVKFITPPFSSDIVPVIRTSNILNASKIKQRRSIHRYHYNTFVYRYNVDSLEDKYLSGKIILSSDSIDRIPIGKKQLKIESDGLRNTPETTVMIENVSARLVERYQYAPAYFDNIEVNYKTGYSIEVGDVVPFGGDGLKVINLQTGKRGSPLALFEVINKSLNVKNGLIQLSLVSTSFEIFARYAVIGLSSIIGVGSSQSRIKIEKTNDTGEFFRESDKWAKYVGQYVTVRSEDYAFEETLILLGVDPSDKSFLVLDGELSVAPGEGYIIEPSEYLDADSSLNDLFKIEFAHFNASVGIVTSIDNKTFEVASPGELVEGSLIYVHSRDFTRDSFGQKVKIDSIVGSTVTLDTELTFVPLVGDFVENSNYLDGGFPYTMI